VATVVRHALAGLEGFRVESPQGLLGWVEETWLGSGGEPVALAVRTIDGRDGLLVAEDVDSVLPESELVSMRADRRLLELELPRVEEPARNGLSASWRTTGELLEPPEPPGLVDRALLSVRPWRLTPPRRESFERPLWVTLTVLYSSLAAVVGVVIGLCFLIAKLVSGNAV
jgi:hypothetical protein